MSLSAALWSCQDHYLDDHYAKPDEGTAQSSLLEVLESDPSLSEFTKIVKDYKVDKLLDADQTFTVWAPVNGSIDLAGLLASGDSGAVVEQLLNNHINRYVYNEADLTDTLYVRIKMLNGKFQTMRREGTQLSFAEIPIIESFGAHNGVVHKISGVSPFYLNIYEQLKDEGGKYSALAAYIESFDEYIFNKDKSVAIGKNHLGQLTYDSVFDYRSAWMRRFGDIYKEDSTYTMLAPTQFGWNDAYTHVSGYFRTFGECLSEKIKNKDTKVVEREFAIEGDFVDSLTHCHTSEAISSNLVFRRTPNVFSAPGDSLVNTAGNSLHHPEDVFGNARKMIVSNGVMYSTDRWTMPDSVCFFKPIVVEAENTKGRYDAYANVFSRSASASQMADSVSGQKFIEVKAATSSARSQPMVQFTVPNTLAATYDVYVVFAPAAAYVDDAEPDSTRVNFFMNYVHEDGRMYEDAVIKGGVTNGTRMTKMFVTRIMLPFANFSKSRFQGLGKQQLDDCVRIRIQTNVAANETTTLTRTMRIDKIVFQPVYE